MAVGPPIYAAAQKLPILKSPFDDLDLLGKPITPVDHQLSLPPSAMDPESLTPEKTEDEEQLPEPPSSEELTGDSQEQLGLMLAAVGVCVAIFNSVLQAKGQREHPLFEPLVASIVMGFFSSIIGVFYALYKKKEGSGRRQPAAVERVNFKWLIAGWVFTVIAFVLWVSLHLTLKSLWKVLLGIVVGSVPLVAFFNLG